MSISSSVALLHVLYGSESDEKDDNAKESVGTERSGDKDVSSLVCVSVTCIYIWICKCNQLF